MIESRMGFPGAEGREAGELVFNGDSVSVLQDEKSATYGWG